MTNKQRFFEAYKANLERCMAEKPYDYMPGISAETIFERMAPAIERGSFNKDSDSFKRTCKQLGISHTYKAIAAFIA